MLELRIRGVVERHLRLLEVLPQVVVVLHLLQELVEGPEDLEVAVGIHCMAPLAHNACRSPCLLVRPLRSVARSPTPAALQDRALTPLVLALRRAAADEGSTRGACGQGGGLVVAAERLLRETRGCRSGFAMRLRHAEDMEAASIKIEGPS